MEKWMWMAIAIAIYGVSMMIVGIRAESGDKKSKSLDDYFLGGRSMGPLLSLGAMTTTMLSSFALLGMPGYFYRFGVGSWMLIIMNVFALSVLYFPYIFRIRRLGFKYGFVTMGDFMEMRYDHKCRLFSAVVMIIVSVPYVGMQIQGFGNISEGVSGGKIPFIAGAIFLSVIMTIYIFQGGYRGVAATDAVQGLLMVFALLTGGIYLCKTLCGSVSGMFQTVAKTNLDFLGLPGGSHNWTLKSLTNWFCFACGMCATPQIFQKFLTNKDLKSMRTSVFFHPLLTFCIYTGAMLIGLAGVVAFPGLTALQSDNIAMLVIKDYLPVPMGMFITCGIVAAAMSTADSQYITISSLFVRDIYQMGICRNKDKEPDMEKMVQLSRWFSVILLLCGFAIAYARIDTLVGLLTNSVYPVGTQIYIPLMFGLHSRRVNANGAFAGMVTGTVIAVLTLVAPPFKVLASIMHPLFWGAIPNIIITLAVSYSTKAPDPKVIEAMVDDIDDYVYDPAIQD